MEKIIWKNNEKYSGIEIYVKEKYSLTNAPLNSHKLCIFGIRKTEKSISAENIISEVEGIFELVDSELLEALENQIKNYKTTTIKLHTSTPDSDTEILFDCQKDIVVLKGKFKNITNKDFSDFIEIEVDKEIINNLYNALIDDDLSLIENSKKNINVKRALNSVDSTLTIDGLNKIEITSEIQIIFETLNSAGYECFMVGGCVRDFLLNKVPHDVDFTTNATPEEMKKCFKNFNVIETGIKHGTLTVLVNHVPYEITTYRIDGEYLDNRRPENVVFVKDIKNDLARRDFTINAIAYNPTVGFVDYFNGIQDLKSGIIKCVNEPLKRLNEDALRILRALRFSAVLGYVIESETEKSCFELSHLLKNISSERIAAELFKTIVQSNGPKIIFDYVDIWGVIIPELLKMKGFEQHNPHHVHDVLKHTCVALEGASQDLIIRLAVLFHDIGKPDSYTMDEKGNGHFYGHALKSVDITKNILDRLKVDNNTKYQVLTLIKHHDLELQATEKYVKRLCYKLGDLEMVKKLILVQRADNYGQAPIHEERIEKFNQIDEIIKKIEQENLSFSLKDLAVNGNDIVNMGIKGKEIGESLNYLLEAVLNDDVKNVKQDLLDYLKKKS